MLAALVARVRLDVEREFARKKDSLEDAEPLTPEEELEQYRSELRNGLTDKLEISGAMIPDKSRPIPTPMPARPAPRLTIIFPMVEGMAPSAMRKNSNFRSNQIGPDSWIPAIRRNNFRRPPVTKCQTGAVILASGPKDNYRQICANR
jgi:hypothetical protein